MSDDAQFTQEALEEARKSLRMGEVPVGAVLVSEGKILSRAHNESISRNDPTGHAEIIALREACRMMNNYRLPGCTLYVTLEPCAMCMGAAVHARIERLVFGTHDPKGGAVESAMAFPLEKMNHDITIEGGMLAKECGKILKDFFKERR
jgi:tRNA(adenine34) deaminase